MILTGKAAEAAEEFESRFSDLKVHELSEDEQIDLFKITVMFERDKTFKLFMIACSRFFSEAFIQRREGDIARLIVEMLNIAGGE